MDVIMGTKQDKGMVKTRGPENNKGLLKMLKETELQERKRWGKRRRALHGVHSQGQWHKWRGQWNEQDGATEEKYKEYN